MSISIDIQHIQAAEAKSYDDYLPQPFDTITVRTTDNGIVKLYLPHSTGQSVADAINAAVAK